MEDRKIKTHKFSTAKLQNLISEEVCRTLRFDLLNLEHDMEKYKEQINPNCCIFERKEFVQIYVATHAERIGETLRESINSIFSHQELEAAYSNYYMPIFEKLYEHFKKKTSGDTMLNNVILMMLEYRVEGYIQEEIHRADY